jgi:hypothetical protein
MVLVQMTSSSAPAACTRFAASVSSRFACSQFPSRCSPSMSSKSNEYVIERAEW